VKRSLAAVAASLLAALVILPALPAIASTDTRGDTSAFTFESFDAQYTISRDDDGFAVMKVVETLVAVFPDFDQNRGILRTIPKYYGHTPLNLSDFAVHDERGDPVYFEQYDVDTSYDDSNGYEYRAVELALGTNEYVHGRMTYVISYTAHDVVRAFTDSGNDELYWDVNGTEWQQPFDRVSAEVRVDKELESAMTGQVACYSGYYGATDGPCTIRKFDGDAVVAKAINLGPYSNLSVAVEFEAGTFAQPDLPEDSWIIRQAPLWLLIASVVLLVLALGVRFFLWKDKAGRGIVIPQYSATAERDLLEDGDLVGRESAAIAAQFVDLAVRGFVQVVDLHPDGAGFGVTNRFALAFVTAEGATKAERTILNILFDNQDEPGEQKSLGSLDESVGAALYEQTAKARRDTIAHGMRAQPSGNIDTWLGAAGWAVVVGYIAIFIWTAANEVDAGPVFGFGIAAIVLLFIMAAVLGKPYLLTDKGADARDYLRGLRDYLQLAEEDRLRVLQSPQGAERVVTADKRAVVKLNEKLLPYAVLWGVEREWSRQLEVEYTALAESPDWISGDLSSFNLGRMLSDFSTNSTSAVRPIVTTSSSSGGGGSSWSSGGGSSFSSGSGGGGFSGGGGGGGGGGGR
jgi:uncharacterized membrane protein YgcG